ncbi:MAG: ParB/RepB/Spo0J family partition protein [Ruminococcaceae bacterium]|nr:ParB/RepB/Spo0J family partition protein [Oscillospiraceae bacterium]
MLLPQSKIRPNPNQPRKHFDFDELEGLAQSIRSNGIIQPLTVRKTDDGEYELISGERRLRAARLIGMTKVPAIIIEADEEQSTLLSVLENIQRSDLDFFEEALALDKLLSVYGMSQEEIGRKLGRAQPTLSNKLRLLKLNEQLRYEISKAGLSERHARALLKLETDDMRERALSIIIDRHLNVEESERLIFQMNKRSEEPKGMVKKGFRDIRIFINTLNHAVDAIRRAGIDADSAKSETDEYIEYVVRIPKQAGMSARSAG